MRMNFGDKPAGRVLDLVQLRMSEDPGISKETAAFLRTGTYVNDGMKSSQSKNTIETISSELGPLYEKYSLLEIIELYSSKEQKYNTVPLNN